MAVFTVLYRMALKRLCIEQINPNTVRPFKPTSEQIGGVCAQPNFGSVDGLAGEDKVQELDHIQMVQFLLDCRRTKTKEITLVNHNRSNQRKLVANTRSRRQARENQYE